MASSRVTGLVDGAGALPPPAGRTAASSTPAPRRAGRRRAPCAASPASTSAQPSPASFVVLDLFPATGPPGGPPPRRPRLPSRGDVPRLRRGPAELVLGDGHRPPALRRGAGGAEPGEGHHQGVVDVDRGPGPPPARQRCCPGRPAGRTSPRPRARPGAPRRGPPAWPCSGAARSGARRGGGRCCGSAGCPARSSRCPGSPSSPGGGSGGAPSGCWRRRRSGAPGPRR